MRKSVAEGEVPARGAPLAIIPLVEARADADERGVSLRSGASGGEAVQVQVLFRAHRVLQSQFRPLKETLTHA